MVAIRAALNLEHGAMKDFYICSLSSRYLVTSFEYFFVSAMKILINFVSLCAGLLSTRDN